MGMLEQVLQTERLQTSTLDAETVALPLLPSSHPCTPLGSAGSGVQPLVQIRRGISSNGVGLQSMLERRRISLSCRTVLQSYLDTGARVGARLASTIDSVDVRGEIPGVRQSTDKFRDADPL